MRYINLHFTLLTTSAVAVTELTVDADDRAVILCHVTHVTQIDPVL